VKVRKKDELTIDFIPDRHEGEAAERLNAGVCDIYTRSLPICAGRTRMFGITVPVYTTTVGLVVKDHRRDEFRQWAAPCGPPAIHSGSHWMPPWSPVR
jgi:hypothetical protein